MRFLCLLVCTGFSALVAGCTIAPNVNMTYLMPKARMLVTVTQTIACSQSSKIVSVASGTISTSYVSDYAGPHGTINFSAPDNWLVDTDTGVTLTDDGRLSSINAAYTGEGAAVVKSLVSLAGTFAGGGLGGGAAPQPLDSVTFCKTLAKYVIQKPAGGGTGAGTTQPAPSLSLSYQNQFDIVQDGNIVTVTDQLGHVVRFASQGTSPQLPIPPDANSQPLVAALGANLFNFTIAAQMSGDGPHQPSPAVALDSSDQSIVTVPKLNVANFVLNGPVGDLSKSAQSSVAQAVIPTRDLVAIPIGRSQPFGKITTTLSVASSGLVTKLEYNKGSGAADLVTAATQVAGLAYQKPMTAEQQASEVQGQADLIYQQQRLAICRATPAQCSSK